MSMTGSNGGGDPLKVPTAFPTKVKRQVSRDFIAELRERVLTYQEIDSIDLPDTMALVGMILHGLHDRLSALEAREGL